MITLPPSNLVVHNLNADGQIASTTSYQFGGTDVYYDVNHKLVTPKPGQTFQSAPTHTIFILYPDGNVKTFASQSANGDSETWNFEDPGYGISVYHSGPGGSYSSGQLKDLTVTTGGGKYQVYKEFTNSELTTCRITSQDPDHPFDLTATADISRSGADGDQKLLITLMNKDHLLDPIKIGANQGNFDPLQLISSDAASLIGHDGASIISSDSASLSLIGHDGASIISSDGASLASRYIAGAELPDLMQLAGKGAISVLSDVQSILYSSGHASLVTDVSVAFQSNDPIANPKDNPGIAALNLAAFENLSLISPVRHLDSVSDDSTDTTGRKTATVLGLGAVSDSLTDDKGHWYKVSLTAGQTYVFDLKGASSGDGTLPDPWLKLFDSHGVLLKEADDGGIGYNSKLVYQATTSGSFYLMARNYNDAGIGTYHIEFSKGSAAPEILSNGGGDSATINVAEHVSAGDSDTVTIVSGWDLIDGNTLKYSLSGEDAAQFELNPFNGYLSFHAPADYETPRDANHDNIYHVTVAATNSQDKTDSQDLTINVLNMGDPVNGTNGDDTLAGSDGDDIISPLLGHDIVDGKGGNDRLVVDYSSVDGHVIFETQGPLNYIAAGNGGDFGLAFVEYSNIEEFTIHGSLTKSNTLTGGDGDDVLIGGTAGDSLVGGAGDDTIGVYGGATQDTTGSATVDLGKGGNDLLIADYSAATEVITFNIYSHDTDSDDLGVDYSSYASTGVNYGDGHSRLTYSGVERFNISGGSAGDTLTSGDGSDTLKGNGGDDTLDSGRGAAVIDGGTGIDLWKADLSLLESGIFLDFSDPSVSQSLPDGSSIVNVEHVELISSSVNDIIKMSAGFAAYANTIATGDGNDTVTIYGGATQDVSGDNTVNMGKGGDDLLVADYSAAKEAVEFRFYGHDSPDDEPGVDYYSYSNTGVYYGDDHGRLTYSGVERFYVSGGSAGDTLTTGDGSDVLNGNGGNDILNSGKGKAVIDGGAGVDQWVADLSLLSKKITLDFSNPATAQTLSDGSSIVNIEYVSLTGSDYDDVIKLDAKFAAYANTINSGIGNDKVTVFGGATQDVSGDNTVNMGNGGDDTLMANYAAATEDITFSIYDSNSMKGGRHADYSSYANTGVYYGPDQHARLTFSGVEQFNITGGKGNDTLSSGDWADTLVGGGGDDVLKGGAGNDKLAGDSADPAKTDGDDQLTGGAGRDQLLGGGGADTFIFDDGDTLFKTSGRDTILGFSHRDHDKIDLSQIDANGDTTASDDAFTIFSSKSKAMANVGALFIDAHGSHATLFLNTDKDPDFEMAIDITNLKGLTAADIIL